MLPDFQGLFAAPPVPVLSDHLVQHVLFEESPLWFTCEHTVEVKQPGGIRRKLDKPPPRQLCFFPSVSHSPGAFIRIMTSSPPHPFQNKALFCHFRMNSRLNICLKF